MMTTVVVFLPAEHVCDTRKLTHRTKRKRRRPRVVMLVVLHAAARVVLRQQEPLLLGDGGAGQGHLLCEAARVPVVSAGAWLEGGVVAR